MSNPDTERENPFEITAETQNVSRRDRYEAFFDLWIVGPAKIIWRDFRTRIGLAIISLYALMGTVGVIIVPVPQQNEAPPYLLPFSHLEYPLGTGALGKGVAASIIHATPAMLQMMISGAVFATVLGTVVGTVAGYERGMVERVLMTITDIMMTIPGLPLLIVLSIALEPRNPLVIGAFLSINAWAGLARNIRSQVLSIREESYVEVSHIIGDSTPNIIAKDILPNIMPYVLISFMGSSVRVIYDSVGLYFLGVLPFTTLNWGVMINLAYKGGALQSMNAIHWLLVPMITISVLTYGLIMFSQGLDRVFNPRVRARHASGEGIAEEDVEESGTSQTGGL